MGRQPTAQQIICCLIFAMIFPINAYAQQTQQQRHTTLKANADSGLRHFDRDIDALKNRSRILKNLIRKVSPAVVHIEAIKPDEESSQANDTFTEAGAGVIIQHLGRFYVLTNLHVVKGAKIDRINILLTDGRFFRPVGMLSDSATDIALLQVRSSGLQACEVADSDSAEIGDFAIAMGSPFGLKHTTTFGLISARGRRNLELGDNGVKYQNFIQTDASINPGNSGGPLINLDGKVIGINTAIASNSGGSDGIGFSIPMNMAMWVSKDLIEYGRVRRSYLGVTLDSDFTLEKAAQFGLARYYGARVTKVTSNSPAYHAGIETNDLILQFNGVEIQDDAHLVNVVSAMPAGKTVGVVVMRNQRKVVLNASVRAMRSL